MTHTLSYGVLCTRVNVLMTDGVAMLFTAEKWGRGTKPVF